jgi:prepilin signal peptidase PulO-like enzyme (type II secretory pathway)
MAFWLNKGAFFIYFSTWAIVLVAIPLFLGALFEALQLSNYASFVVTPFSMAAITVLYCTFFATWKGCFIDNSETIPETI